MNMILARAGLLAVALGSFGCAFAQSSLTEFRCSTSGGTNCTAGIPDAPQAGLVSTIPVTATTCTVGIRSIQIRLDVTHEWVGDLVVNVSNPAGTTALVLDRVPATPAGAAGSCQGDDVNALFATGGTLPQCAGTIPAIGGNVRAAQTLGPLVGVSTAGDWTLEIQDAGNDNAGFLNDWSVLAVCTNNIALPGPNKIWLLLALIGIATLGSCVVARRS